MENNKEIIYNLLNNTNNTNIIHKSTNNKSKSIFIFFCSFFLVENLFNIF